jgi:hypothetical protein
MKKVIAFLLIPVLLIGLSVTGCRQDSERKKNKEQIKVEMNQIDTIEKRIEKNVYPLPTSASVIKMLTDLDVGYQFGLTNPKENATKYISSSSRSVNMGVFGADLSYCTLYNINQEVMDYLNSIRTLADELNMSKIYDETLYERIKANVDNKDALVKVLTDAFDRTYSYLADNEQQNLALLVVGGAWVEGMYLTCNVSEAAYQVAGISRNLIEQKKSFEMYLEITKPYETDPGVADFLLKLEPIKKVYAGLTTSLTEQNIKDITKAINEIRVQIIQ